MLSLFAINVVVLYVLAGFDFAGVCDCGCGLFLVLMLGLLLCLFV